MSGLHSSPSTDGEPVDQAIVMAILRLEATPDVDPLVRANAAIEYHATACDSCGRETLVIDSLGVLSFIGFRCSVCRSQASA